MWVWYPASTAGGLDLPVAGRDGWGAVFELEVARPPFSFEFKDGAGPDARWEAGDRDRTATVPVGADPELWAVARSTFVYRLEPASLTAEPATEYLAQLGFAFDPARRPWAPHGATPVDDGLTLFGLYHPSAARVAVTGDFNARAGAPAAPLRRRA